MDTVMHGWGRTTSTERREITFVDDQHLGSFPSLERRLARLNAADLPLNVGHSRCYSTPRVDSHSCM